MKKSFDTRKSAEAFVGLVQNAFDGSKKVAMETKKNVGNMIEKSKSDHQVRKLKKLNPVFPEQFKSDEFNLPNMIMIVDDAVRRGIDLCEGSIGWLSNNSGVEMLCLYDEAVEFSGVQFIPSAVCDAIYYVDNFDRKKFIRTDYIFSKAHEEKIAELKHIAYCLGAKRCSIEISESTSDVRTQNRSIVAGVSAKKINSQESQESSFMQAGVSARSGKLEVEFDGNNDCEMPELKWFSYDDTIKRLIEMRMNGKNIVKSETLELSGASSATMSQKIACAIDNAIGKIGGAKGNISMNAQAEKEHHSKLIYHIEF